ncbi:MAG: hypothetical protein C0418_05780 [Coriobacteriaceae bacterium]|nr:hypothetical protein [Coriobacteriaceae bacterium]
MNRRRAPSRPARRRHTAGAGSHCGKRWARCPSWRRRRRRPRLARAPRCRSGMGAPGSAPRSRPLTPPRPLPSEHAPTRSRLTSAARIGPA